MRVLVACEFSGVVRDAFTRSGHFALSCDLQTSETPGPHYCGNVYDILLDPEQRFDIMIAFPPCTYLCSSGARWWNTPGTREKQTRALLFVNDLLAIGERRFGRVALENPIGRISTCIAPPSQIIQPWQFGHGEVKSTCLWLRGLPKLLPTRIVDGREERIHRMPQSKDRSKERSRTFPGIAEAMADQWGDLPRAAR